MMHKQSCLGAVEMVSIGTGSPACIALGGGGRSGGLRAGEGGGSRPLSHSVFVSISPRGLESGRTPRPAYKSAGSLRRGRQCGTGRKRLITGTHNKRKTGAETRSPHTSEERREERGSVAVETGPN